MQHLPPRCVRRALRTSLGTPAHSTDVTELETHLPDASTANRVPTSHEAVQGCYQALGNARSGAVCPSSASTMVSSHHRSSAPKSRNVDEGRGHTARTLHERLFQSRAHSGAVGSLPASKKFYRKRPWPSLPQNTPATSERVPN